MENLLTRSHYDHVARHLRAGRATAFLPKAGENLMESKRFSGQLGQRVRAARKAAKLNGQELAAKIGMSQSYISEIERGNRNPSLPTLLRIAQVLDCPASYFLQDAELSTGERSERADSDRRIGIQFGQYLSRALSERNIHPEHFCQSVGIKLADLRRLSLGFLPPRHTIEKMAEFLELDAASLLLQAGYVPTPYLDQRLHQLLSDERLRAAAFKLVTDFNTDEAKEHILQVLGTAKDSLAVEKD